jgi:hypothetical protein
VAEMFYAPWSVAVLGDPSGIWERFIIAGSDASDGVYAGVPGNALATVSGQAWTIAVETRVPLLPGWLPTKVRRSTAFTTQAGLMVYLRVDDNNALTNMVLVCRSLNPAHSPMLPILNPYKFTVSEEAMSRYRRSGPSLRHGRLRQREGHRTSGRRY